MPIVDDTEPAAASTTEVSGHGASGAGHGDGQETLASLASMRMRPGTETPAQVLDRLKDEAAKMKAARKTLQKNLKNARRQNARLKTKARKLTNDELLAIVAMRTIEDDTTSGSSHPGGSASSSDVIASPTTARSSSSAGDVQGSPGVDMERMRDRMEL